MNVKELKLTSDLLELASNILAYNGCNDVDERFFSDWTKEERIKFVKDFHDFNGDPHEFNPNFLHIPDYALMSFLADKIGDIAEFRKNKLNNI